MTRKFFFESGNPFLRESNCYFKGMSINIFPIFSEKTCLQMSKYLESYARWGLPRINIWNFPSHSIDPYKNWGVICLQSSSSSCLIEPAKKTEIDAARLMIMIETRVIAYFNRIDEYFWSIDRFKTYLIIFAIFREKVYISGKKIRFLDRLVVQL